MPRETRETLDPQGVLAGTICLVTGGAGFIGSHIVELLLDAGASEVRVIDNMVRGRRDNLARALASNRVRLIEGDIRDTAAMKSLVAGCDTVFHQAALRITQCAQEPRAAFEVMVAATYDLVEFCLAANIRKLVAAGLPLEAVPVPKLESGRDRPAHRLTGAQRRAGHGLARRLLSLLCRLQVFGSPLIGTGSAKSGSCRSRTRSHSTRDERSWSCVKCPSSTPASHAARRLGAIHLM